MASYVAIRSKEDAVFRDSLDADFGLEKTTLPQSVWRKHLQRFWPWLLHLTVFTLSISVGFTVRSTQICPTSKDTLLSDHPYDRRIRLNGTFNRDSPFKGPPSPEVDKAWEEILPLRLMSIPETVFQTINTSKESVKTPPYLGEGRLAIFEGFHHLHCVRTLWKAAYPEYYTEEAELSRTDHEEWAEHIDHCADMLRQKFICEADSSLITYSWLKNHYNPHPNFNVEHRCKNYDRLLEASGHYGIPLGVVPEGGIRRPTDREVVDFVEPPFDPLATS